ncbi:LysE family translocator [Rhodobacter sp. NTK016B]|uniref:LysE family translocator n=1 Tax=Rhodobacter sp. NTK016B TaxID=2759676 RepID=UPI001A904988|nr:LysE family translocator [Rhodobacter sp. NTK016B]MBN8292878.1 LysE family translocator [Rhodobacter sp. NTK016B]
MPISDLLPILVAWVIAISSPGPATLAISGTAMERGRAHGLALAWGVASGSAVWGLVAGAGLGAAMLAHAWLVEVLRYAGAGYLAWLAWKSARSAWQGGGAAQARVVEGSLRRSWVKGALIHLTNPKAVLFWGAVFAVAVPSGASAAVLWEVGLSCLAVSVVSFTLMALAFSAGPVSRAYLRAKRGFDAVFAALFGFAALKILTARLT